MVKKKKKKDIPLICEIGTGSLPGISKAIQEKTIDLKEICPGGIIIRDDTIQKKNKTSTQINEKHNHSKISQNSNKIIDDFARIISISKKKVKKALGPELMNSEGIYQLKQGYKSKLRRELAKSITYIVDNTLTNIGDNNIDECSYKPLFLPNMQGTKKGPYLFISMKENKGLFDRIVCNNWVYMKTYPFRPEILNKEKTQFTLMLEHLKLELKKLVIKVDEMKRKVLTLEKNPWLNMHKYFELVELKAPKLIYNYEQINKDIRELFKTMNYQKTRIMEDASLPSEENIMERIKQIKRDLDYEE